jgi:hypothetical protein
MSQRLLIIPQECSKLREYTDGIQLKSKKSLNINLQMLNAVLLLIKSHSEKYVWQVHNRCSISARVLFDFTY